MSAMAAEGKSRRELRGGSSFFDAELPLTFVRTDLGLATKPEAIRAQCKSFVSELHHLVHEANVREGARRAPAPR